MASRSSRSRPDYDDPRISRQAYPDPRAGLNDDAYEYVGSDAIPDPPSHTFDNDERRSSRRHSPPRRHKSHRSSTLPAKYADDYPSPPKSRRAESPVPRASRHSDSPPRHRRSRHETAPAPRRSRGDVVVEPPVVAKNDKAGRWQDRPAVKNMKTYGTKGLRTFGDIVEAYAAAQAGGAAAGRGRSEGRGYDRYDDYHDDRYDRPARRSRRQYSPSPSPSPPRRSAAKRSDRRKSTANAKERSYSTSPPPKSRGYNSDDDRRHRRRSRRYSPSPSPSPSPRRRRGRSYSHADDASLRSTRSRSEHHPHMKHYKNEMRAPNPDVAHRWQLAARAALEAGGVTAFRLRKEPGSWTGPKGAKVVTAALGAAAIDSFVDKDPRRTKTGGIKGMAESVVGGMLASKIMGVPSGSTRSGKPRKF
ncbi:hypothetical protein PFICI_07552 [Pestalotiopsis fici W106-1]|uniref:Uncharacterized protein n=1 Tax=Pestalotiopsis fici (strain W106-1 / CGMCC3.15140) TaxID=1229662 RepID=W3X1L1_PESFW|nr:uncharacterized protein PFICI_07552 [Pestalotiopsis fici W106-1]ETS80023.1 hypothetical protein PFICI_07552 [Pestalotiopsis fici W106-1]